MNIEQIKEQMCDKYCKWPEWFRGYFKDPDVAEEVMLNDCCADCPLNEISRELNEVLNG